MTRSPPDPTTSDESTTAVRSAQHKWLVALLVALSAAFLLVVLPIYGPLMWAASQYLLASGALWQGVGLIAFGVFVIGLVDNLLRPILVGRDTKLPDWLVLINTIGGIALVGINAFVIGPVVASLFLAVWGIYGERQSAQAGTP